MGSSPECCRYGKWIDTAILPPDPLIATIVQFAMMQSTKWNREPVADLATHRRYLRKLDVMRVSRSSSADEAGLNCYKLQMMLIAFAHRLADIDDLIWVLGGG